MEIKIDKKIRDKWHSGYERTVDPSEVIIHGTGGGGTYNYVLNGGDEGNRIESYKKGVGLFHYLIDREGHITEIIDPERWVFHSHGGWNDVRTIGIEMINNDFENANEYTWQQYNALFYLLFFQIMRNYKIKLVMSHNRAKQLALQGTKKCPGLRFDWDLLENEFINKGYYYNRGSEAFWDIEFLSAYNKRCIT